MLVGTNFGKAPALLLDPKSRFGPSDEMRFIDRIARAARGIEIPLPVVFGRRVLGYVVGQRHSPYVWYGAGLPSVEYINQQAKAGMGWRQIFSKNASYQAGWWTDNWATDGSPVSGGYTGAAFTAVQFSETTAGAMWHGGNQSPLTKHLVKMSINASAGQGTLILYDRVLTYEACTFNASVLQAMTNTLPALRYISAGQPGMQIMVTAQAATGATAANLTTLAYTDDAGNAGVALPCTTPALSFGASSPAAGVFGALCFCPWDAGNGTGGPMLTLAPGDLGVRKIESYTTSAANTGTMCFVLMKPMAYMPLPNPGTQFETDLVYQLTALERIYDGACLAFLVYSGPSSPTPTITGYLDMVWG